MHTAFDSAHGKPNGRIILISIACYVMSLMLPAYDNGHVTNGGEALAMGWLGPLDGHFSWYANLFYFWALAKYRHKNKNLIPAFIGLALSTSFMFASDIFHDEGIGDRPIRALEWGYFLWVMAMLLLTLALVQQHCSPKLPATAIGYALIVAAFMGFGTYWWMNPTGQWQAYLTHQRFMAAACPLARQEILHPLPRVRQLYFPDSKAYPNMLITELLERTDLQEIHTGDSPEISHRVFTFGSTRDSRTVESEAVRYQYNVVRENSSWEYGTWTYRERIFDRQENKEVAYNIRYGYRQDEKNDSCGEPEGYEFIQRVLQLYEYTEEERHERMATWRKEHPNLTLPR